jgi:hypothetical protein
MSERASPETSGRCRYSAVNTLVRMTPKNALVTSPLTSARR